MKPKIITLIFVGSRVKKGSKMAQARKLFCFITSDAEPQKHKDPNFIALAQIMEIFIFIENCILYSREFSF